MGTANDPADMDITLIVGLVLASLVPVLLSTHCTDGPGGCRPTKNHLFRAARHIDSDEAGGMRPG
jgi:hypothetical protein